MATATKKSNDDNSDEKVDLFIAPYQQQYSEMIHAAREAAETTATPAWQNTYRHNVDQHRQAVKFNVDRITSTCESINGGDTYEEAEKEIAKSVKALADERIRFGAWHVRAVQPYQDAANNCTKILERAMQVASNSERDNPLVDRGLTAAVQERVAQWPHAEWDDSKGVVTIDERRKADQKTA